MKFEKLENKINHIAVDIATLANEKIDTRTNATAEINYKSYGAILDEMSFLVAEIEHMKKTPLAVGFVEYDSSTGEYTLDGRIIESFDRLDIIYNCVDVDNGEWEILNKDSDVIEEENIETSCLKDEFPAHHFIRVAKDICLSEIRNKKVIPVTVVNKDGTTEDRLYIQSPDYDTNAEITGIFAMMRV